MENNKNRKSVKFQGDMLNFCYFIQVFVFTRNHHLNVFEFLTIVFRRRMFRKYISDRIRNIFLAVTSELFTFKCPGELDFPFP